MVVSVLNSIGLHSYEDVKFVKAGSFQMGSENGQPDENPIHIEWVSGFYIDRFEVSINEWNRCLLYTSDAADE